MRAVDTLPVQITTSVGTVSGEFWSDREVGIGLKTADGEPSADRDGYVNSPRDLGDLIAALGVPSAEAHEAAQAFWNEHIEPVWPEWEAREARREAREQRPSIWRRFAKRFVKPF